MDFLRDNFKKLGKGIKKLGKKIGGAFKKVFKGVGKFFSKLGPIGTMAMMIVAPYILGPLMAGIGSATGLGATAGTAAGAAGTGAAAASAAVSASTGISGAVAKTMFSVGKALGTAAKTVTGALEGTLNVLGGGSFTAGSQAAASGLNIGTSVVNGAKALATHAQKILELPGDVADQIMPGDSSWLAEQRNKLFGEPTFSSTGELITRPDSLAGIDPSKANVEGIDPDDLFETGLGDRAAPATRPLRRGQQRRLDRSLGIEDTFDAEKLYSTDISGMTDDQISKLAEGFIPEESYASRTWDAMQDPNLSIKQYPQPSLLASAKMLPRRAVEYSVELPGRFVRNPYSTTADVSAKTTLARRMQEFISPTAIPRPYTGGAGGTGAALGIQQLGLANIDYSSMTPDTIADQDVVFTSLIDDDTYSAALMDVLDKNMMYGIYA